MASHRCLGQAETCGRYLSKGRQVFIEGKIQTRQWDDRDGNKRYTTEIVARDVSDSLVTATAITPACLKADKEADTRVATVVDRATKAAKVVDMAVVKVAAKVVDTSSPRTKATVADKTLNLTP